MSKDALALTAAESMSVLKLPAGQPSPVALMETSWAVDWRPWRVTGPAMARTGMGKRVGFMVRRWC